MLVWQGDSTVTELWVYEELKQALFLGSQVRNIINHSLLVFQEEVWISVTGGNEHFHPFLQECIIDEDCDKGKYCQFSTFEYKCQLCKTQNTVSPEGDVILCSL